MDDRTPEQERIDERAPTHDYKSCNDKDRSNADYNGCVRCTLLELDSLRILRKQNLARNDKLKANRVRKESGE